VASQVRNARIVVADLSLADAAERLVEGLEADGDTVSCLINNAGFGLVGPFASLPFDRQREMIDLNIRCLTLLCHRVLPPMIAAREGAILNVASTAAFQAGPGFGVYFASKAYVLSFTEALHQELKGSGVRVSALCPGPTSTEFGEVAGFRSRRLDRVSAKVGPVVAAGLAGLDRNKAVVIPGLINKTTAQASRLLPRAALRRIVAALKQ
jgi:short-subunit dehydrogenase